MKRAGFSRERIIGILPEPEPGMKTADLTQYLGVRF
jgi:hypothetical protein